MLTEKTFRDPAEAKKTLSTSLIEKKGGRGVKN